ncbi:MAG: GTPase, partial [Planctomycetota bacterium]
RPPQIAVLGPTQTGKSTVVNLLLGRPGAEVSPLAGFTVHAQGFWLPGRAPDPAWAAALFPGWRRVPPAELSRGDLAAFSLSTLPAHAGDQAGAAPADPTLPECVLWDTPDFDSLAARQYERGVLEVAGLADVYLLVLSKEKYSDLSVWHMLELLEPLRRPLLICVNKMTPDAEESIARSLHARLAERGRGWGDVPIAMLPHDPALGAARPAARVPGTEQLRARLAERITAASDDLPAQRARRAGVQAFLRRHWDAWSGPIRAEHAAQAEWLRLVAVFATDFMAAYTRDYLDHPQRYDTFRLASLELLRLLELPRIGGAIAAARRIVTTPARLVLGAWRALHAEPRPSSGSLHSLGAEADVLIGTLDTLWTALQRDVLRRAMAGGPGAAVWRALEHRMADEQAHLRQTFEAAVRAHHAQMTREIREVAHRLYAELEKQPARLAALRSARVTIDLGSMLLAVKTAGLTPMDLVWAPATFALTSLLMEGFAGLEMTREARALKRRQHEAVEREFVHGTLVRTLQGLAARLAGPDLLGISPAQLAAAARALQAWEARA